MHHVDENNVIFHHIVLAQFLMISYLYLEESTNKRSINGIVQFICKLHDRQSTRYDTLSSSMRCDEERYSERISTIENNKVVWESSGNKREDGGT